MPEGQKSDLLHCHKLYGSGFNLQSRAGWPLPLESGPRARGRTVGFYVYASGAGQLMQPDPFGLTAGRATQYRTKCLESSDESQDLK